MHIARLALQQQWACDVEAGAGKRRLLERMGLYTSDAGVDGYFLVSGSPVLAEYVRFRSGRISDIEAGVLYGYPPSAAVAFAGIVATEPTPRRARSAAEFSSEAYIPKRFPPRNDASSQRSGASFVNARLTSFSMLSESSMPS